MAFSQAVVDGSDLASVHQSSTMINKVLSVS